MPSSEDEEDEDYVGQLQEWEKETLGETDMVGVLERLRGKLDEFEKIREELKTQIESATKLLPGLNEERERPQKALLDIFSRIRFPKA